MDPLHGKIGPHAACDVGRSILVGHAAGDERGGDGDRGSRAHVEWQRDRKGSQDGHEYARALETRNLASIIGADELSARDRRYLEFAEAFEQRFVQQGEDENRSIDETLNLAWDLLSMFPRELLIRVSEADLEKYHHRAEG